MASNSRPASTSARPVASPLPRPDHRANTQTKIFDAPNGRILCIADIRGRLSALNDLAREANAAAIIHTGDFGFFGRYILFKTILISPSLRIEQPPENQRQDSSSSHHVFPSHSCSPTHPPFST